MTLSQRLRRLFARRPRALTQAQQLQAQIDTRTRVRTMHRIAVACRANDLTASQRNEIERRFARLSRQHDQGEALRMAVDLAGQYSRQRQRNRRAPEPWAAA